MNLCDIKAASTSGLWKTADVAPDQFPAGLRVLVVDDDPTCLRILEKMLLACFYKVTKCNRAEIALSLLRQDRNGFDVVISDVHMPDMDGFKLLERIGLEMDLPVIMMSADDGKDVVMKGVTHGACDYLIKPVRIEALKNIWQHVVRKRKNEWKDIEQSGSVEDGDKQVKPCEDADNASSVNEGSWRNSKKRKDEEDDLEERDDTSTLKKPRVVWSVELHQQFVAAVHQLGIDKAVPKKILEMMNVPGLTRENVASHLQKYRLYLRRVSGVSQHQNGFSNSFMTSPQEATFGQMSSLNGIDFQSLAASGQLQAQSLATLQASALGNQRNIFSFENPNLRFEQQQQPTNSSSKPVNLLHGIPTTMELKQLSNFHPSAQSFGGMSMQQSSPLMMQIAHAQSRRALPNEATSSQLSTLGLPKLSNGLVENGKRPGIITVSEASSLISFPSSQTSELSGISFPLGSTPGMSSNLTSKGVFQKDVNSNMKQQNGCAPSNDIFNEKNQQSLGLTYGSAPQHLNSGSGNLDVLPSVIVHHQGFSSSQKWGHNGNIGNAIFSAGESSAHRNVVENIDHQQHHHHHNPLVLESARKVKTERNQDSNFQNTTFFGEQHFGQEDLMSVLLKQQESIVPVEAEFDFEGYSIDNIPV